MLRFIGEAASKVFRPYRDHHADIPGDRIIAFRHRLVHDYPRIELSKVWGVVQNYLPDLILKLEPLVPPDEGD